MKSSIQFVDVDRPETWTRYRNGLCHDCVANCCTMPVEVRLPDLVRLGLVDPFEAEHEQPKQIAKRLRLAVESIDLLGPELSCRYLCMLDEGLPEEVVEEEETQ